MRKRIGRVPLLVIVIAGIVLTVAGFTYWGGNNQGVAFGRNANELDRRAPAQQREFARLVDGYFARKRQLSKEGNAVRGNPLKEANIDAEWKDADKKLLNDLTAVMSKTGGRFENWVGRVQLDIKQSPVVQGQSVVWNPATVEIVFHPDGILERTIDPDHPVSYYDWALIKFATIDSELRPAVKSSLGQALAVIDVKKKVRASGMLKMTGSSPSFTFESDFPGMGGSKVSASFTEVLNF